MGMNRMKELTEFIRAVVRPALAVGAMEEA